MKRKLGMKIWGGHGSAPSMNDKQLRFGGNTSCVEIIHKGSQKVFLDGGTGLANAGQQIAEANPHDKNIHIFFSHYHWDHISGFPFFTPIYLKNYNLFLYGLEAAKGSLKDVVSFTFSSEYSPIYSTENLQSDITYVEENRFYTIEDLNIEILHLPKAHPGGIWTFRITQENQSIVYATDVEVSTREIRESLVELSTASDVLIIDCQYTEENYKGHIGWGHSTFRMAADIAAAAGVRRVVCFHISPFIEDDELLEIKKILETDYPGIRFDIAANFLEIYC